LRLDRPGAQQPGQRRPAVSEHSSALRAPLGVFIHLHAQLHQQCKSRQLFGTAQVERWSALHTLCSSAVQALAEFMALFGQQRVDQHAIALDAVEAFLPLRISSS
jgi:hypothetical protein